MTVFSHSDRYEPTDRMASLIAENYQLLQVMSRFGIPLGFGDDSVEKTCCDNGVDCSTFLAVVNFISEGYSDSDTLPSLSVEALLDYLRQSHIYFLEYFLPAIRKKLLEGIRLRNDDVSFLILKFFDDYVGEVRIHMDYEEKNVFPYVKSLLSGNKISDFRVNTYSKHHDRVGSKLKELKKLIIKYCPESKDINILNDALYDIYRCEDELESHCLVEDCLLVPAILQLENKLP